MNYKLFDDFITLQAILKELGVIQSGGAIKAFLQDREVYVNEEAVNFVSMIKLISQNRTLRSPSSNLLHQK